MDNAENTPLFEVVEALADSEYPEAWVCPDTGEVFYEETKLCRTCNKTKPNTAFMRRASMRRALAYTRSSVDDASPHHFVMDVVHNTCNECNTRALKRAARKTPPLDANGKPVRIRRQSADDYDAELRAHGRYEYMVPNPYRKYDTKLMRFVGNEFVPYRYIMVQQYKERQIQRRAEGTQAAKKRKYAAAYKEFTTLMKREYNRINNKLCGVKQGTKRVITIDEQAQAFCKAYIRHLATIKENIRKVRYADTAIAPKPSPIDYIRDGSATTIQARELYRALSSKNQEALKPKYL